MTIPERQHDWHISSNGPSTLVLLWCAPSSYHRMASAELSAYMKRMEVGDEVALGDLRIRSFEVPHDATENVGYAIDTPVGRFTFVTDIGQVTPTVGDRGSCCRLPRL